MVTSRVVWTTVAGLALVASVAWALNRGGGTPPPERAAPVSAAEPTGELARLRAELDAQRTRNRELSGEVEWLRAQLALLGQATDAPAEAPTGPEAADAGSEEATPADAEKLWFDGESLLAGGVAPYDVERLRESFDASEMSLIELENQARREGWFRTRQYWQSLRDLRIGLREEIGDEAYDQLLYATGRKNRVVLADVLRDSPGARAGLQPGDVVMSYDGRRIFKPGELKRATTRGELGDRVPIDVIRDGEWLRFHLERGPIGAQLGPKKSLPEVQ